MCKKQVLNQSHIFFDPCYLGNIYGSTKKKGIALEMLAGYKNNQIGNKAFICPICMGILFVES